MRTRRYRHRSSKSLRRENAVRIVIYVVLILLIFSLSIYIFNNKTIRITRIDIAGNRVVSEGEIVDSVLNIINEKYLGIFAKSNILFVPKKSITASLISSYPRIEDIKIGRNGLRKISVDIDERKPEYLYCDYRDIELDELSKYLFMEGYDKDCYFMDGTGFAYAKALKFTTKVYFEYSFEDKVGKNPIGEKLIEERQIERDLLIRNFFKNLDIEPVSILYMENGDRKFFIERGTKIIFNESDDIFTLLDNLESVISSEVFLEKIGNSLNNIHLVSYIDLRFGRKVYYKIDK